MHAARPRARSIRRANLQLASRAQPAKGHQLDHDTVDGEHHPVSLREIGRRLKHLRQSNGSPSARHGLAAAGNEAESSGLQRALRHASACRGTQAPRRLGPALFWRGLGVRFAPPDSSPGSWGASVGGSQTRLVIGATRSAHLGGPVRGTQVLRGSHSHVPLAKPKACLDGIPPHQTYSKPMAVSAASDGVSKAQRPCSLRDGPRRSMQEC